MDAWYPDATQNRAPSSLWGTYVSGRYKGVLHSTESTTFTPSASSYYGHTSYPHFTDAPQGIYQHIPIDRAARALKSTSSVQTNRARVIQIEVVGTARRDPSHSMSKLPAWRLERLRRLMVWIEEQTGVKPKAPTFYDDKSGFTLATPTARQRMSAAAWSAYDGWCGHQHVPVNDHWDPGTVDIGFLLDRGQPPVIRPIVPPTFIDQADLEATVLMLLNVPTDDQGNGWRDTGQAWAKFRGATAQGWDPPFMGAYLVPRVTCHNANGQVRVVVAGGWPRSAVDVNVALTA